MSAVKRGRLRFGKTGVIFKVVWGMKLRFTDLCFLFIQRARKLRQLLMVGKRQRTNWSCTLE